MKTLGVLITCAVSSTAMAIPAEQVEFFEKKIRPVLAQHCYECHNSIDKAKGDLALDYKDALLKSDVIVPGKPDESDLILSIRHESGYEKMPSKAPKLDDAVIRDFEQWVRMGAPDPRLTKPTKDELDVKIPWEQLREQRRSWWAFQPVRAHPIPAVSDREWAGNPIDHFVYAQMTSQGLTPQGVASPEVLVRRLHLVLTGLPPQPAVVTAYVRDPTEQAYEALVDSLLSSKAFGERWARHWMDWYRYAESHGSEGDPPIPFANAYRDYLIRALNADVPYDQLLIEHLAGDLLDEPRVNAEQGLNESAIGPAHLRMVPHGFGVTDAYGEQITFTDNQIDVLSKAMLGVTVSCARCHNHKFDPISQNDFYRMYGVMVSNRASTVLVDDNKKLQTNKQAIADLKPQIRNALADFWLSKVDGIGQRLVTDPLFAADPKDLSKEQRQRRQQIASITHPLEAWFALSGAKASDYRRIIDGRRKTHQANRDHTKKVIAEAAFYVDLRDPESFKRWNGTGNGTIGSISPAGTFAVRAEGGQVVEGIYPRGVFSHLISDKHAAVLGSGNFMATGRQTMVRVAGRSAELRVPIRNYPLTHGGLHPASKVSSPTLTWQQGTRKWGYWQTEKVHYELRTSKDIIPRKGNDDRSWFGIAEVYAGNDSPRPQSASLLAWLDDVSKIENRASLIATYQSTLRDVLNRWKAGTLSDQRAEFLDGFVRAGLLPNALDGMSKPVKDLVAKYRALEREIPVPTRAPGVLESEAMDQPFLVRGLYKQESDPVKRQFLEIFSDKSYDGPGTGRLELAKDIVSDANTLKSRVLVNRLWSYVFGRGIVSSTDNFGRLGKKPTHPELLDYLSLDFERDGWSIKQALRKMVTSRTFRSSSQAAKEVRSKDPENALLSHFTPRRLDAEAIYDSVGQIGGRFGRAVYLPVIRNRLNAFMSAFNAPVPTSTVSFRNNTNVPAQSLVMMNGSIVEQAARSWAARVASDGSLPDVTDKITSMYLSAYGREPSKHELSLLLAFMSDAPIDEERYQQLLGERNVVDTAIKDTKATRDRLIAPIRNRLQAEVDQRNAAAEAESESKPVDLKPIARWDFEGDANDAIGGLHGKLLGKASVKDGVLNLDGGCMMTRPLSSTIREKTLEVLVQLDRLNQRSGGAITIQGVDGNQFDSIVFAESIPGMWLAGSDNHRRTIPFRDESEASAVNEPVRIVMTYASNGTIRAYRNGKPYGKPIRKSGLVSFKKGRSQIVFGLRHGTGPGGNRALFGKIHEARLYDRVLTPAEVAAASSGQFKETVSNKMLMAALTDQQKSKLADLDSTINSLDAKREAVSKQIGEMEGSRNIPNQGYYRIAHALLNSKEFIYVH